MFSRGDSRPGLLLNVSGAADAASKPPGDQGVKKG
jgi:hypothetical protein